MYTYRLDIAYEGENYSGWQIQPNALSIQEIIEEKLSCILKSPHKIIGAGRTDAGVHAQQQVAHFKTDHQLDPIRIRRSLYGLLPPDIRIWQVQEVDSSFHARKSATGKKYRYSIVTGPIILPQSRRYAWHIFSELHISSMQKAALQFIGTHDFLAYANENTKGAAAKNSVRTLYELHIQQTKSPYSDEIFNIDLDFYGNGFLYKMVRNITGMIVAIGSGKRAIEEISESFIMKNRKAIDRAAPAHGLTLMHVEYKS